MFQKRKNLDQISLEELEQLLRLKRRKARQERFIRLTAQGASPEEALQAGVSLASTTPVVPTAPGRPAPPAATPAPESKAKKIRGAVLLLVEVGAVLGLIIVLVSSYLNLEKLNDEVVEAQNSRLNQIISERLFPASRLDAVQPALAFDRLPGGHSSPTAPGGAVPDVPPSQQNWVQPPPPVPLPAQQLAPATRIVIPKISVDAPIVQGVTWEDLKKGVGQLPNSARPGEQGNLYLVAHNDIFGEIFRYLEKLEPGDEYYIYAGAQKFTYVVREKRVVEPTEVSVMLPTTKPIATLQTSHPYLIDTQRLVIIGDLVNSGAKSPGKLAK